jgi:DNA-directed RNA polymerase specialized sigma24 family protein
VVVDETKVEVFTEFVSTHERRLRESLMARFGGPDGWEAAAEAVVYGWQHWDRISQMENPVGYLYKVGLSRGRRARSRRRPTFDPVETSRIPDVEPRLPEALATLSDRQRTVVVLVHCFQWTQSEVGELLGLSKTTVQNHLDRGMGRLRRFIGGEA